MVGGGCGGLFSRAALRAQQNGGDAGEKTVMPPIGSFATAGSKSPDGVSCWQETLGTCQHDTRHHNVFSKASPEWRVANEGAVHLRPSFTRAGFIPARVSAAVILIANIPARSPPRAARAHPRATGERARAGTTRSPGREGTRRARKGGERSARLRAPSGGGEEEESAGRESQERLCARA